MDTEIWIEKEGREEKIPTSLLKERTGAVFVPQLVFANPKMAASLIQKTEKLKGKGGLTREQLWFGAYFKKEIESSLLPPVILRWIDAEIGWGLFAARDVKKREFIGEYAGLVRKRSSQDRKNAYCFEYLLAPEAPSGYNIDAREQGGLARFINHSKEPNLITALATLEGLSHVILYAKRPIQKGEQLTYDYGPDYWAHRTSPRHLGDLEKR